MTDGALPSAENLPAALVTRPQWLCWRTEDRDGKATKAPVEPKAGGYASATDPETWRDFATAREYAVANDLGLGFVFTEADSLVGVDLDDCRDPESGALGETASDIVARLDSFTEVSPSGTGVHVLVKGSLPDGRNRKGGVEMYANARFFTVSGDQLAETPETVMERSDALAAVHAEYVAADTPETPSTQATGDGADVSTGQSASGRGNDLDDEELIDRATAAANGSKFERLYRGSTAGYPSQSEADMALCSLLAFWTGGDATQMDRLFRDSGLLREKWDEVHFSDGATYGERTIERALAGTDEFYEESEEWEPIASAATDDRFSSPSTTPDTQSDDSLAELRRELEALEAENERLEQELKRERTRRQELEEEDDSGGLFAALFQ